MSLNLTEEDINNPDVLGEKLIQLAEIVFRKHYYASYEYKDDLVQVGVLKALKLIDGMQWSSFRGKFYNYLYSGMRNDMHNFLYHENKYNKVDCDIVPDFGKEDTYFNNSIVYINYNIIHSVCSKFTITFGEGIEDRVIEEVKNLGYEIKGMSEERIQKSHTLMCRNNILLDKYGKEIEEDVISRLIGLVLWGKKEKSM